MYIMKKIACFSLACVTAAVDVAEAAPTAQPKKDVEVVAVYYPHWHKYPKGTEWFGSAWDIGEWGFVKSARPRFPGHKQPLVPYPGYLDGANPKDVETEIALAANAGIDVFLWDYYWYGGQITQEEALEQGFLRAKNRNRMKFALMWCYHERRDQFRPELGPKRRDLMTLDHTPEEFLGLIDYSIAHYFNQPEYWRKDGRLFFSIFWVEHLWKTWGEDTAKVRAAMDEARRRVRAAGLGELHLNAQNLRPKQVPLAVEMGFDSVTDYGFGVGNVANYGKRYAAGERLFGYEEIDGVLQKHWKEMGETALPYIPIVPTGWDSTPRCRLDAPFPWPKTAQYPYCATYTNNTPDLFEQYLRDAKAHVLADPKKPGAVYINAWNEYTEGCYLLPNNFDADGLLRARAAVFGRTPANEYTYVNPSTGSRIGSRCCRGSSGSRRRRSCGRSRRRARRRCSCSTARCRSRARWRKTRRMRGRSASASRRSAPRAASPARSSRAAGSRAMATRSSASRTRSCRTGRDASEERGFAGVGEGSPAARGFAEAWQAEAGRLSSARSANPNDETERAASRSDARRVSGRRAKTCDMLYHTLSGSATLSKWSIDSDASDLL